MFLISGNAYLAYAWTWVPQQTQTHTYKHAHKLTNTHTQESVCMSDLTTQSKIVADQYP
jgi:hypothetical protein